MQAGGGRDESVPPPGAGGIKCPSLRRRGRRDKEKAMRSLPSHPQGSGGGRVAHAINGLDSQTIGAWIQFHPEAPHRRSPGGQDSLSGSGEDALDPGGVARGAGEGEAWCGGDPRYAGPQTQERGGSPLGLVKPATRPVSVTKLRASVPEHGTSRNPEFRPCRDGAKILPSQRIRQYRERDGARPTQWERA